MNRINGPAPSPPSSSFFAFQFPSFLHQPLVPEYSSSSSLSSSLPRPPPGFPQLTQVPSWFQPPLVGHHHHHHQQQHQQQQQQQHAIRRHPSSPPCPASHPLLDILRSRPQPLPSPMSSYVDMQPDCNLPAVQPMQQQSSTAERGAAFIAAASTAGYNNPTLPKAASNSPPKLARPPPEPPSRESGGVPDPTPEYLARAALLPSSLPSPRRILVVLDLNGTLLFRPNRRRSREFIARPHAARFLQYCLATFRVVIWSSARPENVHSMCQTLFNQMARETGDVRPGKPVAVWGRDKFCLSRADYDLRVQCYKRLGKIWATSAIQASHPRAASGARWDQTNTVLVDDSTEKARSEPHNLLELPEFEGDDGPLPILPQVHDYLNTLCTQADVSSYIRLNPFKLDPDYKLKAPPHVP